LREGKLGALQRVQRSLQKEQFFHRKIRRARGNDVKSLARAVDGGGKKNSEDPRRGKKKVLSFSGREGGETHQRKMGEGVLDATNRGSVERKRRSSHGSHGGEAC